MNGSYTRSAYGREDILVSLSVRNIIDLLSQAAGAGGQARLESMLPDGPHLLIRVEPDSTHYAGRRPGYGSGEHDALRAALATLVGSGLAVEAAPEPVPTTARVIAVDSEREISRRFRAARPLHRDPALDLVMRQIDNDLG